MQLNLETLTPIIGVIFVAVTFFISRKKDAAAMEARLTEFQMTLKNLEGIWTKDFDHLRGTVTDLQRVRETDISKFNKEREADMLKFDKAVERLHARIDEIKDSMVHG